MQILLINKNPIVSKLMELATQNQQIILHETKCIDFLEESYQYDIIFIDDRCCSLDDTEHLLKTISSSAPKILIANKITLTTLKNGLDDIAHILKKPFLPSHLLELFKNIKSKQQNTQSVLDLNEIATIKDLLQNQASQLQAEKNTQNPKEDINMVDFVFEQSTSSLEDELVIAIKNMKPKKIKKLLKDATINITINHQKES